MNENINLSEILKGHVGETFYSPIFGDVKLVYAVTEDIISYPIAVKVVSTDQVYYFTEEGKYEASVLDGEMLLFPSKDQRDWNKWIEENNKLPKT